jgi:hypothetical protein
LHVHRLCADRRSGQGGSGETKDRQAVSFVLLSKDKERFLAALEMTDRRD